MNIQRRVSTAGLKHKYVPPAGFSRGGLVSSPRHSRSRITCGRAAASDVAVWVRPEPRWIWLGMRSLHGIRGTGPVGRAWTTLNIFLLGTAGNLDSLASAQTVCDEPQTTPIRVQNATGVGTLRAVLNCTGGGEVQVNWAGRVAVDTPIAVLEGTFLSVTGDDSLAEVHADSSLANGTRLFEVSRGSGLTLTRLTLSGGSAGNGGAVFSQYANLTLEYCTFEGNVATDANGGAVWTNNGNVTIVGGEFLGNSATRYGGAVHAVDGSLIVRGGSRFEGNKAIGGGALFCGLNDVGSDKFAAVCSITDARFVSNIAARDDQDAVDFLWNLDGGGAVMSLFASVDITDSVFSANYALLSGGALHGGLDTNFVVNGCKFGNNTSGKYAGAITASSMTLGGGTQLTNNSAIDDGGAVSDTFACLDYGSWSTIILCSLVLHDKYYV